MSVFDQQRLQFRLPKWVGSERPTKQQTSMVPVGLALGALALGALAIGAIAIGALAIMRLNVRRARIDRLEIGELVVLRREPEA